MNGRRLVKVRGRVLGLKCRQCMGRVGKALSSDDQPVCVWGWGGVGKGGSGGKQVQEGIVLP